MLIIVRLEYVLVTYTFLRKMVNVSKCDASRTMSNNKLGV